MDVTSFKEAKAEYTLIIGEDEVFKVNLLFDQERGEWALEGDDRSVEGRSSRYSVDELEFILEELKRKNAKISPKRIVSHLCVNRRKAKKSKRDSHGRFAKKKR